MEYEYESGMEDSYRQNMYKSFKKTIDDGFFPFIIVDAINDRVKQFDEFWSYAKSRGFQVSRINSHYYINNINGNICIALSVSWITCMELWGCSLLSSQLDKYVTGEKLEGVLSLEA